MRLKIAIFSALIVNLSILPTIIIESDKESETNYLELIKQVQAGTYKFNTTHASFFITYLKHLNIQHDSKTPLDKIPVKLVNILAIAQDFTQNLTKDLKSNDGFELAQKIVGQIVDLYPLTATAFKALTTDAKNNLKSKISEIIKFYIKQVKYLGTE